MQRFRHLVQALTMLLIAGLLAAATAAPAYGPALNARIFDRVWGQVDRRYWDRDRLGPAWEAARARYRDAAIMAADGPALYRVLGAMLKEAGDSHVYAQPPSAVAFDAAGNDGRDRAEFGFSSWPTAGTWRVLSVRPDGPAAAAGVRPGWVLTGIDGHGLEDDWHPQPGERTRLRFLDAAGAPRTIELTSALLPPEPTRRALRLPGDILLLGFDGFEGDEARWLRDELASGPPPAGLILDLRENGGGEAIAVARVAGALFDRKQTLLKRVGRKRTLEVPILGAGPRAYTGPLAVLVGPRSASGAEILAALIRDSGRGFTVGETTAGAVTGAAREVLPDGGELSVAVYDIRSAADTRLEGTGFVPQEVVTQTLAQLRAGHDPVVARAVALLGRAR